MFWGTLIVIIVKEGRLYLHGTAAINRTTAQPPVQGKHTASIFRAEDVVRSSETLVSTYKFTQCCDPKNIIKSHSFICTVFYHDA
jgi:hypothetical protein